MKINKITALILLSGAVLSGCSSRSVTLSDIVFTEPLPIEYKKEVYLARLNEFLNSGQISKEERVKALYQRGVLYDSMGLQSLARFDFNQAIKLKPDLAEAYNYLGVYLTLASHFDRAYEAFDSAHELKPDYDFALFSRGIALYYGDRAKLASADLQRFLSLSPNDPYRIIWQYLIQTRIDAATATTQLKQHALNSPEDNWATSVIKLYLGEMSERAFLQTLEVEGESSLERARRLCEAYFYLGKYKRLTGDDYTADNYFRLSLATNVHDFIEHKYAKLELERKKKD